MEKGECSSTQDVKSLAHELPESNDEWQIGRLKVVDERKRNLKKLKSLSITFFTN